MHCYNGNKSVVSVLNAQKLQHHLKHNVYWDDGREMCSVVGGDGDCCVAAGEVIQPASQD